MPCISIIIPVFNGETTIGETLQSLLQQTFQEFEILVIDDGSVDGTVEVIRQFQDPRIQVFSYANAGLPASRNRGITLARGDYITFIDADDCWTATKLEDQLTALKNHPDAALAYSWTDFIDASGHVIRPGGHRSWIGQVYDKLLVHNFLESGSNSLIRRTVIDQVGGFDESLKAAEDWDFHLRIAARYPFAVVPSAQVLYRQLPQSVSSNLGQLEQHSLTVIHRAFEQAPASLKELKSESLTNLYLYLTFKALDGPRCRQTGRQAWGYLRQALQWDPMLWRRRSRLLAITLAKIAKYSLLGS